MLEMGESDEWAKVYNEPAGVKAVFHVKPTSRIDDVSNDWVVPSITPTGVLTNVPSITPTGVLTNIEGITAFDAEDWTDKCDEMFKNWRENEAGKGKI